MSPLESSAIMLLESLDLDGLGISHALQTMSAWRMLVAASSKLVMP